MRIKFLTCISLMILIACGCSGNPATPGIENPQTSGVELNGNPESHHTCLGCYMFGIDTRTYEIEITPLRLADLHLNVTTILNSTMGVSAKGVPAEHDPPNGIFAFDITLKHPFATKPNLTGFDVKGILITEGSYPIETWTVASPDETRLLNADGYTRWWNPAEFTEPGMFGYTLGNLSSNASAVNATINPYKYFADILDATSNTDDLNSVGMDDDQGRGVFSAGASNTRRYRIKFPMNPGPVVHYGYAVDAAWAPASVIPPVEIPDDFPINANQPEAFDVRTVVRVNTLYFDVDSGECGGFLQLFTTIRDWQGQLAGNVFTEVDTVKAYCTNLSIGAYGFNMGSIIGTDKAGFFHNMAGVAKPTQVGTETVAIEIISSDGSTYDQGLGHPAPSGTVGAWNLVDVDVIDPPCEYDTNDFYQQAEDIEYDGKIISYLCTGTDNVDYYRFEVPPGHQLMGSIYTYCDIPGYKISICDGDGVEIISESPADYTQIVLGWTPMFSGTYYIKAETTAAVGHACPYYIEHDINVEPIQPLAPVEVSSGFMDMYAQYVKVKDNYSIFSGSTGIWIYDISDPSNPVALWRSEYNVKSAPAFYEDYMYYISGAGSNPVLRMVDLSDPSNPVELGEQNSFTDIVDLITMSDEHIFAYDADTGRVEIYLLDSDPIANPPQYFGSWVVEPDCKKIDIIGPANQYTSLFLMSSHGLYLYNVENPIAPVLKGSDESAAIYNWDFQVYGDLVIMVRESMAQDTAKFYTLNAGTFTLKTLSEVVLPLNPGSATISWPYAHVAGRDTKQVTAISIEDISNPFVVDTVDVYGDYAQIDSSTTHICGIDPDRGMSSFNISGTGLPDMQGTVRSINFPSHGCIQNVTGFFIDHMYGDDYCGLKSIPMGNPEYMYVADDLDLNFDPVCIGANTSTIFIASKTPNALHSYDITNSLHPVYGDTMSLTDPPTSIAVSGTCIFVSYESGDKLDVYQAPTASSITYKGTVASTTPETDLEINGDTLYGLSGLHLSVYDMTNPENPIGFPGLDSPGFVPKDLMASDGFLYILCENGIATLDISNPLDPHLVHFLEQDVPAILSNFTAHENFLFSNCGENHPWVTDISVPNAPVGWLEPFIGYPHGGGIKDSIGYQGHLYEFGHAFGIMVYELFPY